MDCCGNCDFCERLHGDRLYCAIYDEEVGENDCCPDYQSETRRVDDYEGEFYG